MVIPRSLSLPVTQALAAGKMAFVGGPRQVGKTTLALSLLGPEANEQHPAYFNWDHKRGDSLANRYRHFRLHPFSLRELDPTPSASHLETLLRFGGFPEPLFRQDVTEHRIWQRDRLARVIREDLRDLERVREVSLVEHLVDLLPERVGSPLSIAKLRQDLEVDHKTVDRWLTILENMYICFRLPPFGSPRIRAVKKEKKLYLWDWSAVADAGARFENLVACQLLKYCHWVEDVQGFRMELRYLRDTDRREVDFVVLRGARPQFAVECKTGERGISPSVLYAAERTPIPRFFQVHGGARHHSSGKVTVLPFVEFCRELEMP